MSEGGIDPNTQLPWGLDKNKIAKGAKGQLTADKVKGFTIGAQTKSRFQKHKEELEARKKKEEEEAAKVFEDFVASFEAEDAAKKPTGFVRGETRVGGKKSDEQAGEVYKMVPKNAPAALPASAPEPPKPKPAPALAVAAAAFAVQPTQKDSLSVALGKKQKEKKRGIDELMEEFRNNQSAGSAAKRARPSMFDNAPSSARGPEEAGSFDDGDPETTNLYVGNLHPQVSEDILMKEFGKHGPIASVKIMWPRTEEEKMRKRNCGFVNMMYRNDAERAKDALNMFELFGVDMRIGWGKALPKPAVPIYVHDASIKGGMSRSGDHAVVKFPKDADQKALIDLTAEYIAKEGHEFERAIMERERGNKLFDFMFDPKSSDGVYYKWRVFTLTQSDTLLEWRTSPFLMFAGGMTWVPPEEHAAPSERRSASPERSSSRRKRDTLSEEERDAFEMMLRKLSAERDLVGDAMVFAINRAEAAKEVVETLTESMTILETPIPSKIARLYLVSDILHNSSAAVAKASLYRSLFETSLEEIFQALGDKLASIDGRITAEGMKEKVLRVLRVWEVWSLYPQQFTTKLESLFLGKPVASLTSDRPAATSKDANIDGAPIDDDVDGEALDGEEWDGEPLDGEDVDGEPMDDLDGEPMDAGGSGAAAAAAAAKAARPKSKWDDDEEGSDEEGGFNPNLPISKWNRPPE